MKVSFSFLSLFAFFFSLSAELKVKNFTGLPFIKRDFEQLYLGNNAVIQENDIIDTNGGQLVLSSDLWSLTLGVGSRAKWEQDGKVFMLHLYKGSASINKTSPRKAYLQLQTPQSLSKGEVDQVLIYTDQEKTKLWLTSGEMDFQSYRGHLKAGALKTKVQDSIFVEYELGATEIHRVAVNDFVLASFERQLLEGLQNKIKEQSAVDKEKVAQKLLAIQRRRESRNYLRTQRADLIESIHEAVLEDAAFTFSFPIAPPAQ